MGVKLSVSNFRAQLHYQTKAEHFAPMTSKHICRECKAMFMTQESLSQHLLDHNRLRAITSATSAEVGPTCETQLREKGYVMYYNEQRGYGFIKRFKSPGKLYFHITACENSDPFSPGEKVSFTVKNGPKGEVAASVERSSIVSGKAQIQPPSPSVWSILMWAARGTGLIARWTLGLAYFFMYAFFSLISAALFSRNREGDKRNVRAWALVLVISLVTCFGIAVAVKAVFRSATCHVFGGSSCE